MAYVAPYMLATGDYGGRICVWNIFTGERRFTLTHEAPEYQRGVEQLLFLRPHDTRSPPILLSCGGMCTFSFATIQLTELDIILVSTMQKHLHASRCISDANVLCDPHAQACFWHVVVLTT